MEIHLHGLSDLGPSRSPVMAAMDFSFPGHGPNADTLTDEP